MAKTTKVILLERIDPHGKMGDVVSVKPGFARNYLLPQQKALRATDDNLAYFEGQKKELEAQNETKRKDAEKIAKSLEGLSLVIVRQAGDKGQLYGSVSSRDISEALSEDKASKDAKIGRSMINLNTAVKDIGLFPVEVILHPEVRITIEINVARNEEEAKIQKKTGQAIIADEGETPEMVMARAEEQLEAQMDNLLEEDAASAEKEKIAEEEAKAQEEAEKIAKQEQKAQAKLAEAQAAQDSETVDQDSPESDSPDSDNAESDNAEAEGKDN